ncbi:bifunctional riboflavin kinase/FAD synthetase [Chloroflexota bacterium]
MQVEKELAKIAPDKNTLLTIGVFDGVHLGHKYLVSRLTEQARKQGLLSGVLTFNQHPQEIISPGARPLFLTSLTEKIELLNNEGVDVIIALSFTPDLAMLSARQFVTLLKKHLLMRGLFIGPDFALGQNREGNVDALRRLGQKIDFTITVIPPIKVNGEIVSSTTIRKALTDGDMKRASNLIGRSFSIAGQVVTGSGRGLKLGFPTANLENISAQVIPADGIYATRTHIDSKVYRSVTSIGWRPTFSDKEHTVETHIIGYDGNLYGQELKIDIVEGLRGEKKFSSVEELQKQITNDIEQVKTILGDS